MKSKSIQSVILKRLLFSALLIFALSSCRKKQSFPFQIINHSNYDISSLTFSGVIDGEELSLNTSDTSQAIILSYERRFRLTPKSLCLSVNEFSGANGFSHASSRPCLPFKKNDLNEDLNTIVITSEESADSIRFEITLN